MAKISTKKLMALALTSTLFLSGCGGDSDSTNSTKTEVQNKTVNNELINADDIAQLVVASTRIASVIAFDQYAIIKTQRTNGRFIGCIKGNGYWTAKTMVFENCQMAGDSNYLNAKLELVSEKAIIGKGYFFATSVTDSNAFLRADIDYISENGFSFMTSTSEAHNTKARVTATRTIYGTSSPLMYSGDFRITLDSSPIIWTGKLNNNGLTLVDSTGASYDYTVKGIRIQ